MHVSKPENLFGFVDLQALALPRRFFGQDVFSGSPDKNDPVMIALSALPCLQSALSPPCFVGLQS
jgi:hypothetical protein